MKNPILEKRIVPVARPTDSQKAVLSKIVGAATPRIAASEISDTPNLSTARDMLEKLGLIRLDNEGAFVTDQGNEVMLNQNLVTQTGELTNDGQIHAYGEEGAERAPDPSEDDFDFGLDDTGDMGDSDGEELDLGDENINNDDEQGVGLELDMGENFSLINDLRDNVITEGLLSNVPRELLLTLTPVERAQLERVVDGREELYDYKEVYDKLYSYFVDKMPYGTAKGRDGDPDQWIMDRIRGDIGDQDLGSMIDAAEYQMDPDR